MNGGYEDGTRKPFLNPSSSGSTESCSDAAGNNDAAASFECNICFELAQDPIVTLCGHLYCWPCLYKWLHLHSHSQECPVCKAVIQEEKLVPLYGRGKTPTDPRSKSIPGVNIPNRPAGQRPETAPSPDPNHFPNQGFGFRPMATARFGSFTLSAALNGFLPSLFSLHVHGFPDTNMYGATGAGAGIRYGYHNSFHGAHAPGFQQPPAATQDQEQDSNLPLLFLIVGALVLFLLMFS